MQILVAIFDHGATPWAVGGLLLAITLVATRKGRALDRRGQR